MSEAKVTVERFVNGCGDWVRFETTEGCDHGTLHNSAGDSGALHVDDIEHRKTLLRGVGWIKVA